ncbi:MAG: hypothetical protein AAGE59_14185 [Cyanobacteria bacterium P01_F01_bin.86]
MRLAHIALAELTRHALWRAIALRLVLDGGSMCIGSQLKAGNSGNGRI